MRRIALLAVFAAFASGAWANDGMELRTKAIVAAGVSVSRPMDAPRVDGPFIPTGAYGRDPLTALMQIEAKEHVVPSASCEASGHALCYNLVDGRIVYRGAREYMPKVQGLTPESLGMRHNRVVFSYSFK
jgi:hypothetical protein